MEDSCEAICAGEVFAANVDELAEALPVSLDEQTKAKFKKQLRHCGEVYDLYRDASGMSDRDLASPDYSRRALKGSASVD